jgi:hypothetical protein
MSLDIKFDPSITIVNTGCGYAIWQGGGWCHKTLAQGFKTEGQAVGWTIDNGYATVERNFNKQ